MATSVTYFSATVPAGTLATSLHTVTLNVGTAVVTKIRWRVPPGPRGNLGWALSMGGVQVVPDDAGAFIIADNEYDDWEIENLPDSGAWQLQGYNTGAFDHTVYLGFFTQPIQLASVAPPDASTGFPLTDQQLPSTWLA